ncbi:hypothetical protein MATL_G00126110 [Megalops atlanticus]|uniref:FXYD domain-containing ion transport regulator n=1 Tax=Megalops atlanticus TaxID=7932 RepID=A0A9D3PZ86_MEGAT|nr:hypothetical protein MATL_G00126110 [Megalops atlanticus]
MCFICSQEEYNSGSMDLSLVLALCSCVTPALGSAFGREMPASSINDMKDEDSAFHYDYESLRIGGLIFAVVLFFMGILLILSRKCRCRFNQQQRTGLPDAEAAAMKCEFV